MKDLTEKDLRVDPCFRSCSNEDLQRKAPEAFSSSPFQREKVKQTLSGTCRMRTQAATNSLLRPLGTNVCYFGRREEVRTKLNERGMMLR